MERNPCWVIGEAFNGDSSICESVEYSGGMVKARLKHNQAIVATVLGTILGETVGSILTESLANLALPINESTEYLGRILAWDIWKGKAVDAVYSAIGKQIYVPTREDASGVNYDDDVLRDIFEEVMYATIVLTTLVSEDAGEIAMESLQEAISNAIYATIGGQITSIANYRVGFMPPQNPMTNQGEENAHPYTRAIYDAFTGYNIWGMLQNETARLMQQYSSDYERFELLHYLYDALETASNPGIARLALYGRLYRNAVQSLQDAVFSMLNVLWRRAVELKTEVDTAYYDWTYGFMEDSDITIILKSAINEADRISSEIDNILQEVQDAINSLQLDNTQLVNTITSVVEDITRIMLDYASVYKEELDKYWSTVKTIRQFTRITGVEPKLEAVW